MVSREKQLEKVSELFKESIEIKKEILIKNSHEVLIDMANVIVHSIKLGGKLLLCGNGGSAADAQHLAAELLVRLRPEVNREGVAAIALASDPSTLTACGNDFGFDLLFKRMVQAIGNKNDVLLAITTSGNSKNIIFAMQAAKQKEIPVLGFLGSSGGEALGYCEKSFLVPSSNTGRIQESHITAGHALMELVEDMLLEDDVIHQESQL